MMRRAFVIAVLAGQVLFGGSTKAQTPEPEPTTALPSGLEEEVVVRLVQVRVTATDRRGKPIDDLKADEIRVGARGVRRRVAYLEPLRKSSTSPAGLPDVELFVAVPGGAPLGSSSVDAGGGDYVAFFIDVENDYPLKRVEALDSLIAFAKGLPAGTLAAVLSFDGELHLDLPFTSDRESVVGMLAEAWSRHGRPEIDLQARIGRLVDQFGDCVVSGGEFSQRVGDERCLQAVVHEYVEQARPRTLDYLLALRQMIQVLAGVEGRKTIFAFTHGVAVDATPVVLEAMRAVFGSSSQVAMMQMYSGFGDQPRVELDRLLRLAIQSGVTMHVVDRTPAPSGDLGARRGQMLEPGARPMMAAFVAAQADAKEVAASTGGTFVAAPDLDWGLEQVANAEKGAYEVGFYVDELLTPQRLAKLDISTTRKGVRLAHRRGEYAAPEERSLRGRIILGAPRNGARAHRTQYEFQIEIDPQTIGYRVTAEEAQANFTLHVMLLDRKGTRLTETHHFINHAYPKDVWDSGKPAPMTVRGWIELPEGAYELAVYLHNTETSHGGRLVTAVEVAPERDSMSAPGAEP